jgi:hypothetical protein
MGAASIVARHVLVQGPAKMTFVEDNQFFHALFPHRSAVWFKN